MRIWSAVLAPNLRFIIMILANVDERLLMLLAKVLVFREGALRFEDHRHGKAFGHAFVLEKCVYFIFYWGWRVNEAIFVLVWVNSDAEVTVRPLNGTVVWDIVLVTQIREHLSGFFSFHWSVESGLWAPYPRLHFTHP